MAGKGSIVRLQYKTSESKGKNTRDKSSVGTTDAKYIAISMVE